MGTLSNSLTNTANNLVALQSEVKKLKSANMALKTQLLRTEEQNEVLQQERTTVLRQLEEAESTASAALVDNSDLSHRVLEAEQEALRVRREKAEAAARLREVGQSYQDAKRESNTLLAQLRASETRLTGLRQDLGDVITKRNTWEMMERDLHSTKFTTEEIDDDGIVPHHHSLDDSFCEVCGK